MPYKSDAQRRYFNANKKKLKRQGVDVEEWNDASRGMKLPAKVKKQSSHAARRKMASYIDYLGRKLAKTPGVKQAGLNRPAVVAQSLRQGDSLPQALVRAYPEKSAADRSYLAGQLVRGLSFWLKRAAVRKSAMGASCGMTLPAGVKAAPTSSETKPVGSLST